jgi:hypothetical protein
VRSLLTALLALSACAAPQSPGRAGPVAAGKWVPITIKRLEGLRPVQKIEAESTRCKDARPACLRREGGMLCHCNDLVLPDRTRITSPEGLKAAFAPVASAAEAADFVALQQGDLAVGGDGIITGHTYETEGGYLVQVVRRNTFGCGSHEPTGMVFKVSRAGDVTKVSEDPPPPKDPTRPNVCVD